MNILLKLKHKLRGEQCPRCKSYLIIQGVGYSGLKCITCRKHWELRDLNDDPIAPQVYGKKTLYEEYLDSNNIL